MAQDFGDDIGDWLRNKAERSLNNMLYNRQTAGSMAMKAATDWYKRFLEKTGKSSAEASAEAEVLASRPQVCIRFGSTDDAAYFAKVCQDSGVYVSALSDESGNGFLQFAKDDTQKVCECVPHFSEVMTSLKNHEIAASIENAEDVSQEQFDALKPVELPNIDEQLRQHDITLFPVQVERNGKNETLTFSEQDTEGLDTGEDIFMSGYSAAALKKMIGKPVGDDFIIKSVGEPYQVKATELDTNSRPKQPASDTPLPVSETDNHSVDEKASAPYSHTFEIRDKVLAAREQCTDRAAFKSLLAKEGIGVTQAADGDLKLYEARRAGTGEILPYDKHLDWSVNAKTLASDKYRCDVTNEWFEKNTPKEPSAHAPIDRQSTDLNLICNAVRGDLEEKGIQTLDRPDGKMGFIVDQKYKRDVADAVETRFPGHAPEELGIEFDDGRNDPPNPPTPPVIDGSLDMDGRTPDLNLICNAVRGDLEEKGIQTLDRPDGKMGFIVDAKYRQDAVRAVENRFPGHAPSDLGIDFYEPHMTDGSLDMDGRTPDLNQGIESHDGADTATATARIEREQVNSDVAPSAVRESSGNGKGYDLKSTAQECRDGSKQLEKESGIGDRDIDISDKFDRNR